MEKQKKHSPWSWVPTLYFAEGLPYVIVMSVAVIMYKRLGISNTDIALYTSWLYLPWVIKPFWSPFIDLIKTKRWWIVLMQLLIGAALAGVAFTIPTTQFFQYSLAFFWLLAFSSATHDIAADGFYMLGLKEHEQAYFVGIRSTFYRFAMITGQGLLIILAGYIESSTGLPSPSIKVSVVPQSTVFKLDTTSFAMINPSAEQSFILSTREIKIGLENMDEDSVSVIKSKIRRFNEIYGFVANEDNKNNSQQKVLTQVSDSSDLKNSKSGKTVKVGGIGVVRVYLSKKPEDNQEIVLNMDRDSGDKDISLVQGARLKFDQTNWNKGAFVVFQVDGKLKEVVRSEFKGVSGNISLAWSVTFFVLMGMFIFFFIYHHFILPHPASDQFVTESKSIVKDFGITFVSFFEKKNIGIALAFILLFRLGESQLVKLASPFLLDSKDVGGLGLTTGKVGFIYGTIGVLFLTIGGILGGWLASKKGLKYWIFPMTLAMNLPNLVYVYLSFVKPESMSLIAGSVAVEQFGYGFGFTAFMLYMIYFSEGNHKTAHYAICTGLMALGMMIPGMISGWLQEIVGYKYFFVWVMICTIPGFVLIRFLKIDPEFGIKKE